MRTEASFSLENGHCDAEEHRDILLRAIGRAYMSGQAQLREVQEIGTVVQYRVLCDSYYTFQLLMHALRGEGRELKDLQFMNEG